MAGWNAFGWNAVGWPWLWPLSTMLPPPALDGAAMPDWTSPHREVLTLSVARLLDFSRDDPPGASREGLPILVVAPCALHRAMLADFAPGFSLMEALRGSLSAPLYLFEPLSAVAETADRGIDDFLLALSTSIDEAGGRVRLVGLCQGGWLALILAARFPHKVERLALIGSPIDMNAAESASVTRARETPEAPVKAAVTMGGGVMRGAVMLDDWHRAPMDAAQITEILQVARLDEDLHERFMRWHLAPLDLPGRYFLEVAELFRENSLARGEFRALGRKVDLARYDAPLLMMAGRHDPVTPAAQLFAVARLVGTPRRAQTRLTADSNHLGLFMGRRTVSNEWRKIASWLARKSGSRRHT
jgi:poly(3-hydroxyalkanoate) synthetase